MIFPLGRKHLGYGANVIQMEILALLLVKSLMKTIPKEEVGDSEYDEINEAYIAFFKIIVYWLKFGFNYEAKVRM